MTEILHYSVIHVEPDAVRGERINIGVVAWNSKTGEGAVHFAPYRERLRALGVTDTAFVADFRSWLAEAVAMRGERLFASGEGPEHPWSLEAMKRAAKEWGGMIRLSEPHPARASSAAVLAAEVYDRAVRLRAGAPPEAGKQAIRQAAARRLRTALKAQFGESPPLTVGVSREVQGQRDPHVFDVVLMNGGPKSVLVTPNLADPRTAEVRRDLEAAAWSIYDVSRLTGEIRFAVLRDGARPAVREHVDTLISEFHVEPLSRGDLDDWVAKEAHRPGIPSRIGERA
jgi:hypothetical protein